MSKTRSISALAAGLGILAVACWFVTATFPLAAAPQMIADGPGITVDTGGAVLHRAAVAYPDAALSRRIQGVVTLEATVDGSGNVVDTRVLGGPAELRRAAQQSVLYWHFAMDSAAATRLVKISFELPAKTAEPLAAPPNTPARTESAGAKRLESSQKLAPPLEGRRLNRIYIGGLSDQSRDDLMSHIQVHVGDTLAADSLDRVRAEVRAFDDHLTVSTAQTPNGEVVLTILAPGGGEGSFIVGGGVIGGVVGGVPGGVVGGVPGGVVGGWPSMPAPADGSKRITIGGNVQQTKLVSQPRPLYPPLAKQARISGVVRLAAVIGKEGNVINLAVISGHPLLVPSALEAVRQWVYQTTLLNGDPVEVVTQIDVNYTLSDDPPVQQPQ